MTRPRTTTRSGSPATPGRRARSTGAATSCTSRSRAAEILHTTLHRRRPDSGPRRTAALRSRRRIIRGQRGVPGRPPRRRAARPLQRLRLDRPGRHDSIHDCPLAHGGATFERSRPGRVSCSRRTSPALRAPPFVSADVDAGGDGLRDLGRLSVQPSSAPRTHRPRHLARRCRMDAAAAGSVRADRDRGLDRFVPALAVDPSTSGSRPASRSSRIRPSQSHGCVPGARRSTPSW